MKTSWPHGRGWTRGARNARSGGSSMLVVALFLFVGIANDCRAAALQMGTPYTTNGGIAVPVWLSPNANDEIASLQFRFAFDTSAYYVASVAPGPAASSAGKDVVYSEHRGSATVIVAGFNQDVLQGGVVATLFLSPNDQAQGLGSAGIQSPVFSNPQGDPVALHTPAEDDPDQPGNTDSDPELSPGPAPETPAETPQSAPGNVVPEKTNNNRFGSPNRGMGNTADDFDRDTGNRIKQEQTLDSTNGASSAAARGGEGVGGAATGFSGGVQSGADSGDGVNTGGSIENTGVRPSRTSYRSGNTPNARNSPNATPPSTSPSSGMQVKGDAYRTRIALASPLDEHDTLAAKAASAKGILRVVAAAQHAPWTPLIAALLVLGALVAGGGWWWRASAVRTHR